MKVKIRIYTIISLSLPIILILLQNASGAQGPPPLWIMFDSCEKQANVAPGANGLVNFTGVVNVDIKGIDRQLDKEIESLMVRLVVDAGNWSVEVEPDEMIFLNLTKEESRAFKVTVQVPLESDFLDSRLIKIVGNCTIHPGNDTYISSPATGIITVVPYCRTIINCSTPHKAAKPGDIKYYDFSVRNEGNLEHNLSFSVDEIFNYSKLGKVTFSEEELILDRHEEKQIRMKVKISKNAPVGTYELVIRANAMLDVEGNNNTYLVSIEVEEKALWARISWYWYAMGGVMMPIVMVGIILLVKKRNQLKEIRK